MKKIYIKEYKINYLPTLPITIRRCCWIITLLRYFLIDKIVQIAQVLCSFFAIVDALPHTSLFNPHQNNSTHRQLIKTECNIGEFMIMHANVFRGAV